jgi:dolichol kinase
MTGMALLIETLRRVSATWGAKFDHAFGRLIRDQERKAMTGATWLFLSCIVAVVILPRQAAIASLWCAAIGDPAATIAGRLSAAYSGRRPRTDSAKTFIGSCACASVSFVGVWLLAGFPAPAAGVIALAATAAEAMPVGIDDNVRVAGAVGAVAQLLS